MFRDDYDRLRRSFDRAGRSSTGIRLCVVKGKRKNQIGHLVGCGIDAGILVVEFEDREEVEVHYGACHHVDDDGTIRLPKLRDMTGREIVLGSFLCYAVSMGARSFGLEFGTVRKISSTGTMTVHPMIQNGNKVNLPGHAQAADRITISGFRSLLLPLDEDQLTIAMLTDLKNFGEGSLNG